MKPGSLRLRLISGGAAAIVAALLFAGVGLSYLFERQVVRSLASDLDIHLRQALAAIELNAASHPQLTRDPSDPRFAEPLSGLYWQLSTPSGAVTRSRSLWDGTLPLPKDELSAGEVHYHRVAGPSHTELLAIERTVFLTSQNTRTPVRIVVAADLARVAIARQSFIKDLIPALALLATALALATWVQISLGLRPLARMREGIAAIRDGNADKLEASFPSEVAPLVQEINDLIATQESDLERARGRAADLAHGLKTPLSALATDVRGLRERGAGDIADSIEAIGEAMRRHIDHELARVRIRGQRGFHAGAATPLKPLVDSLVAIQRRTAAGSSLSYEIRVAATVDIAMDKADLAEVLGNLLENASRHAQSRVGVSVTADGRVAIDDDGPGVPEKMREWVLKRGRRLDERSGGAGLGLAIVQDVLDAYQRRLLLETSPFGGLRAVF